MSTDATRNPRAAEAAEWLTTLRHEELTAGRAADWLEWAHADPANLEAFERTESLSLGLAALDSGRKAQLLRRVAPGASSRSASSRRWPYLYAAAAAIAVAAIGLAVSVRQNQQPLSATYATGRAENRSFDLPDGSKVVLGADTRLEIAYTRAERGVILREGEAFFAVKEQADRPFLVRAGTLHLTDIGTSFDVRKNGAHVMVMVSEGIVDVRDTATVPAGSAASAPKVASAIRLRAGERITVAAAAVPVVARVSAPATPSWQRGRLDFQDEPLAVVVANVNRYAAQELVIVDPAVSAMRFTGTVFNDRVDDWLASTAHLFNLRAVPAADGRVLLYSGDPASGGSSLDAP